jgi:hypothetical protein
LHLGLGLVAAQDEDRHTVVMVTAPTICEFEGPSADDYRTSGHELVHDLAVHAC